MQPLLQLHYSQLPSPPYKYRFLSRSWALGSLTSDLLKADDATPLLKIFCLQTIGKSWHIKVFTVWLQSISLSSNFSVTTDSILQTTSNICISKFPMWSSLSDKLLTFFLSFCSALDQMSTPLGSLIFSPQHYATLYIRIYHPMLKQISLPI